MTSTNLSQKKNDEENWFVSDETITCSYNKNWLLDVIKLIAEIMFPIKMTAVSVFIAWLLFPATCQENNNLQLYDHKLNECDICKSYRWFWRCRDELRIFSLKISKSSADDLLSGRRRMQLSTSAYYKYVSIQFYCLVLKPLISMVSRNKDKCVWLQSYVDDGLEPATCNRRLSKP